MAADGSHLFWTNNAGDAAEGSVWEANLDGTSPHAIAPNQNGPLGVATDGNHVYWANVLDQAIEQANPDGSSAQAIVTGLGEPELMAVTPPPAALAFTPSPFDYGQVGTGQPVSQTFTLANTGGQATGTLTDTLTGSAAFTITGDTCTGTSLAASGTCTVTVQFAPPSRATFTAALTSASANPAATATVALTGTAPRFLYWINDPGGSESANGTVNRAGLDGTSPHAIVPGQDNPGGIAVGATHIYWPTGGATMNEANLDGTSPQAVTLPGQTNLNGVAVDASHLYWTSVLGVHDGAIWVASLDVTGAHTLVTGQGIFMGGVAVDADHIYWTSSTDFSDGDGAVWAAGLDGSNPHIIVPTLDHPVGMAVSGSHVYWASTPGTGGSVPSGRPASTAATRTSSFPARTTRMEWRPTPVISTGPTRTQSTRPASTAPARRPSSRTSPPRPGSRSAHPEHLVQRSQPGRAARLRGHGRRPPALHR